MTNIPEEKTLDSSITLLQEGFPFLHKRMQQFNSDIFKTRLLGEEVICIHGPEAAQVFYDTSKFQRKGAIPKPVQKTLLGEDGVQTMDDVAHRHRKAMFMSLMSKASINHLLAQCDRAWRAYVTKWVNMPEVVLFEDVQEIMCLGACAWAGVPLKPTEVRQRAQDFTAMVDAFGAADMRHYRGRKARSRTESWVGGIIEQVRKKKLHPDENSPLYIVAWHYDTAGKLLSKKMATVELINLLRPIVAIAYYVAFSALALHKHPEYLERLRQPDGRFREMFVQEVRRFYPFAPFLGARVRNEFDWGGNHFKKGKLVLLDVYGMLHDPRLWEKPELFKPERFANWQGSPFDFIPQGGGEFELGHRCAGEWITIEVMKQALGFLVNHISYEVPPQNLYYKLDRMPTYPQSGVIISNIRRI
ncbi:cytochrome P450 [Pontibacter lucknowensis]|uniref:Fatty-acid peroxygenase n=2 Tax=Pontibacter TaxID=323449 RepID=A0A1N6X1E1_9BACT|nr:cytochrome P450 [Pontibacter lucknowensis]SIQ96157.1 fatty-acid peroxygenase [Pontibacter lucknowensis]